MNSKPYAIRHAPRVEKWFRDSDDRTIDFKVGILQVLTDQLQINPYPNPFQPTLIKKIKGLKKQNPCCYRLRIYKDVELGIQEECRIYYTVENAESQYKGFVILLDISGPRNEDKKQAVERLKRMNKVKYLDILELLGVV